MDGGEILEISCPNCHSPIREEHLIAVLGETGFIKYVLDRAFFRQWQDTLVRCARNETTTATNNDYNVSNKEIFETLKQQEEIMVLHHHHPGQCKELQEATREMIARQRRELKTTLSSSSSRNNKVHRSQAVLSLLATANTIPCPKLLWMLPITERSSSSSEPLPCRWKVFFLCEKTHCLANPETPLELDGQHWLRSLTPVLKVSMIALTIAEASLDGIPLGGISDTLQGVMSIYNEMLSDVWSDAETDTKELGKIWKEMETFITAGRRKNDDDDELEWLTDDRIARWKGMTGRAHRLFSDVALKSEYRRLWEPHMKVDVVQNRVIWVAKDCIVESSPPSAASSG